MVLREAIEMRIKTLGALTIERDGESVDGLASSKAEALLVYLACTGREHPREVLAELLWDERTQQQAMANLRVVLSSLRKEVGSFVTITRATVRLNEQRDVWLDATQLEQSVVATREGAGRLRAETVQALEEALELYKGDFLAGFFIPEAGGFEDWVASERERLYRLALDGLQRLGRWHLEQGNEGAATGWATRLVQLNPLAETGHRQLMEALARGGQRAEALAQYESCCKILAAELGVEPQAETQALHAAIRADTLPHLGAPPQAADTAAIRHNLPSQPAPFVGRKAELAELDQFLGEERTRLITITGLGGSGKTRLALAAAEYQRRQYLERFRDGVFFVSLAPADEPGQILSLIGEAVGLDLKRREEKGRSAREELLNFLSDKRLLLILDNFEHLVHGAGILAPFLKQVSRLTLLVTSREPLRLQEEQIYPIHGFSVGEWDTVGEAEADPAVQLFLQRARRLVPAFELRPEDLPDLAGIGTLTGGMPLALELAASWVGVLSVREIGREIQRSVAFLETDIQNVPKRQRSVEAVFNASWQRLEPALQAVFAKLSVFRGGFDREAAEVVTGAALKELASLTMKSVVQYDAGQERYHVHELLRQFGQRKLQEKPEMEQAVRRRHATLYCRFLEQRQEVCHGAGAREDLDEVAREMGNVRLSWKWAVEQGTVSLLAMSLDSLCGFYERRGYEDEVRELLQAASEALLAGAAEDEDGERRRLLVRLLAWRSLFASSLEEADAVLNQAEQVLAVLRRQALDVGREEAFLAYRRGCVTLQVDPGAARSYFHNAHSLYQRLGDLTGQARVTEALGLVEFHLGSYAEAGTLARRGLEMYRVLGNRSGVADILDLLGLIEKHQGRLAEALEIHRESYELYRELGDHLGAVYVAGDLTTTHCWAGNFAEARRIGGEGLRLAHEVGLRGRVAYLEDSLAQACTHLGLYAEARQHAERAIELARAGGARQTLGWALSDLGRLSLVAGSYEEAVTHFEEAADILSEFGKSIWIVPLIYQALSLLQLGQLSQARQLLVDALRENMKARVFFVVVQSLPAAALLAAELGDVRQALELYALACRYPYVANSRLFADLMGEVVVEWEHALPAGEVEAAAEQGRSRDIWQTAEALLTQFAAEGR